MFYKYEVGWYNPYDDKEELEKGIVFEHDYGSAANRVVHSYGKDYVFEVKIKEIVLDNIEEDYCLPEEELKYAFKED